MKVTAELFFDLERRLINAGMNADLDSFETIRQRLVSNQPLGADEFARQAIYVVLASGFSQKTAKRIHAEIMGRLPATINELLSLFNNKNKIHAIVDIWKNRQKYRDEYYANGEKIEYLMTLPHIGKITANHLARNLGHDVVKYDIWIQRLATKGTAAEMLVDNGNLDPRVKELCDEMFDDISRTTGLSRGYIDVVLWKSCQNGLIDLQK